MYLLLLLLLLIDAGIMLEVSIDVGAGLPRAGEPGRPKEDGARSYSQERRAERALTH